MSKTTTKKVILCLIIDSTLTVYNEIKLQKLQQKYKYVIYAKTIFVKTILHLKDE